MYMFRKTWLLRNIVFNLHNIQNNFIIYNIKVSFRIYAYNICLKVKIEKSN